MSDSLLGMMLGISLPWLPMIAFYFIPFIVKRTTRVMEKFRDR